MAMTWGSPNRIFQFSDAIVTDDLAFMVDAFNSSSYTGSGTTWLDISGFKHHCGLVGNVTYDSGSKSLVFDGVTTTYVSSITNLYGEPFLCGTPPASTMNYDGNCTQEVWIYPTSLGATQAVITGDSNFNEGALYVTSAGVRYYVGGTGMDAAAVTSIATNAWTHLVGTTYKNTATSTYSSKLYINGVLAGSGSGLFSNQVYTVGPDGRITIGYNFAGRISVVRVYSRDLTAAEVLTNYNATKARFGL